MRIHTGAALYIGENNAFERCCMDDIRADLLNSQNFTANFQTNVISIGCIETGATPVLAC